MKKIPVIRMNEHHEAFLCWDRLMEGGYIPSEGNYLLHVDHHDDLECGGYDWSFAHKPTGEEVSKFTYHVLGIADFIIPAVFYKIFSEVHVLKNLLPNKMNSTNMLVRLVDDNQLLKQVVIPFIHGDKKDDPKYAFYTQWEGGLYDKETFADAIKEKSVVLDVDLDYFCWDDSLSTRNPKRIELTKEAYEEYESDPYHPFRILPRRMIKAVEDQGKYYLEYKEMLTPNKVPTKERILKRMDKLLQWFEECGLQPAAIDICSSHYSGYLPKEMYPWIEEVFLEKIGMLWDIELLNNKEGIL